MKRLLLQPVLILATLFILALIAAVVYTTVNISSQDRDKDALVKRAEQLAMGHASAEQVAAQLLQARVVAQSELERLNLFIKYPGAPETLAAVREEVYENVFETVTKNVVAFNDMSARSATPAGTTLLAKIVAEQAHIQAILAEWKKLMNNPTSNSNPAVSTQTLQYAAEVQSVVQKLQQLAEQLTPENSGLTPDMIKDLVKAVDTLVEEVKEAVTELSQPTVLSVIVQQQQQSVDDAKKIVEDLEDELVEMTNSTNTQDGNQNPGTPNGDPYEGGAPPIGQGNPQGSNPSYEEPISPNYPGTRYIPPEPVQDPNKPKLIEGQNPNQ